MDAILLGCLIPATYSAYTDAVTRDLFDYITIPVLILGVIYTIFKGTWLSTLPTAVMVFLVLWALAILGGGISGGDVKFITALTVWFEYPTSLYMIGTASILAFTVGSGRLVLKGQFKKYMLPFFKGIYYYLAYKINLVPKHRLPENGEIADEAIPFGPFFVFTAWAFYLGSKLLS